MHLIGCDFHTRFQQAMVDSVTGEILNRRLDHGTGEAQQFYAALPAPARIGMEATGRTHWFERILAEQAAVFHGFLLIPFSRCAYTVLGRPLSLATPTASPLDGRVFWRFLDGGCCHGHALLVAQHVVAVMVFEL